MDIGMPIRDGIDATREIHQRDSGQHVVIYTGSDQYGDVARADEAGAAGFLHKDALTSPDLADALHVLHTNYVARSLGRLGRIGRREEGPPPGRPSRIASRPL